MIVYDAVNPSLHNRDLSHAGRQLIKFVIEKFVTTEIQLCSRQNIATVEWQALVRVWLKMPGCD